MAGLHSDDSSLFPTADLPVAGDVTVWVRDLRSSDPAQQREAQRLLNQRLSVTLRAHIRERLNPRIRQRIGPTDIYQDVMNSFFVCMNDGGLDVPDRTAVMALLFQMIRNKVINVRAYHLRQKRNVERETPLTATEHEGWEEDGLEQLPQGQLLPPERIDKPYRRNQPVLPPSDHRGDSIFAGKALVDLLSLGADEEDAAKVGETYELIKLDLDNTPPLNTVFDHLLAGYSDEEIANEIGKSVARVRQLIGQVRRRIIGLGVAPQFQNYLYDLP